MGIFVMCYKENQRKDFTFTLNLYHVEFKEMKHELDLKSLVSSVNNLQYTLTERAKQPAVSSCTNANICFVLFQIEANQHGFVK